MANNTPINWFWAHRRNASLHHAGFLMRGMAGKGWLPAVNFSFDHQIIVGVPKKGCYVFYDKDQMSSEGTYKDVQTSIDANSNFSEDFKRRTKEIFGAIFFNCIRIDEANLSLLTNKEIHSLYKDFLAAMMVGPIITVQLWGIEACFDPKYKIMKFLEQRLMELGKQRDFQYYKEMLAVNTGETIAFTEQKEFFRAATALKAHHPDSDLLIDKHIKKYGWINTEYVSGAWPREKWVELFHAAMCATETPEQKLATLEKNFQELNESRTKVIKELNPPPDVLHAITALSTLIAERDWSKGYMVKALFSYHTLLDEIARRLSVTRTDLFSYSYAELDTALNNFTPLPNELIQDRIANGYGMVIKGDEVTLVSGKDAVRALIEAEGISEPFDKLSTMKEFKGLGASRGIIRGKVRVIEDASRLHELQTGEILVTYMTTVEFTPAFRTAGGVITDEGGMSCHAAIISREFKIPCAVGTRVATRVLQTGDEVELDGGLGKVTILSAETAGTDTL